MHGVKTGFMISGHGVNIGGGVTEMGIKDVAPLISQIWISILRRQTGC